jgi:hypothetical protein
MFFTKNRKRDHMIDQLLSSVSWLPIVLPIVGLILGIIGIWRFFAGILETFPSRYAKNNGSYKGEIKKGSLIAASGMVMLALGGLMLYLTHSIPGVNPPPNTACTPQITSVSAFAAGATPTVTIKGSCFGTNRTFSHTNTPYFLIMDDGTTDTPLNWGACYTNNDSTHLVADDVTCTILSWSQTSITFNGFGGKYGQHGQTVSSGDRLFIQVRNPQTDAQSSDCAVRAGTTSTTQCNPPGEPAWKKWAEWLLASGGLLCWLLAYGAQKRVDILVKSRHYVYRFDGSPVYLKDDGKSKPATFLGVPGFLLIFAWLLLASGWLHL